MSPEFYSFAVCKREFDAAREDLKTSVEAMRQITDKLSSSRIRVAMVISEYQSREKLQGLAADFANSFEALHTAYYRMSYLDQEAVEKLPKDARIYPG